MGAVRLSFVIAMGIGAWSFAGPIFAASAWAQDAPPRIEAQPKGDPMPQAQPKSDAQPKAPTKAQPKRAPVAPAEREEDKQADKSGPPPSCGWIGKRVIQSLLRDDAVTAQDFDRLYRTFECPGDYLRHAFDCTVSDGAPQTANEAQLRVESCWDDPKATKIQVPATTPSGATTTTTPGTSAPQPKGKAATGQATPPPPASTTPNYPKGK